jgi:hypothetical protein
LNRHYDLGEKAWELRGIKLAVIDGSNDSFIGHCRVCEVSIDFGARIEGEAVVEVWPVSYHPIGEAVVTVT